MMWRSLGGRTPARFRVFPISSNGVKTSGCASVYNYWIGGIATDTLNRTSIAGLYAVGETSSTGVHGANRLASNSLLECLVYGAGMSQLKCDRAPNLESPVSQLKIECSNPLDWEEQYGKIKEIRSKLPELVWQSAEICRNQPMLDQATSQIEDWRKTFLNLSLSKALLTLQPQQTLKFKHDINALQLRTWGETCNLLDIADLILKSSIFRQESRGGHYRQDYPQTRIH